MNAWWSLDVCYSTTQCSNLIAFLSPERTRSRGQSYSNYSELVLLFGQDEGNLQYYRGGVSYKSRSIFGPQFALFLSKLVDPVARCSKLLILTALHLAVVFVHKTFALHPYMGAVIEMDGTYNLVGVGEHLTLLITFARTLCEFTHQGIWSLHLWNIECGLYNREM